MAVHTVEIFGTQFFVEQFIEVRRQYIEEFKCCRIHFLSDARSNVNNNIEQLNQMKQENDNFSPFRMKTFNWKA